MGTVERHNSWCKHKTKMNFTSQINFETNDDQPYKALICIVLATVIEIIGNGLLALVIVYEKFTMDPQKRTVINQLVTIACFIFLIQNIFGVPIMTYIIIVKDAGKIDFSIVMEHNYIFNFHVFLFWVIFWH